MIDTTILKSFRRLSVYIAVKIILKFNRTHLKFLVRNLAQLNVRFFLLILAMFIFCGLTADTNFVFLLRSTPPTPSQISIFF